MPQLKSFHDIRFPTDIALGSAGGPERRTEVVTLGSGKEQRNARWANARRRYNAGYGIKTLDDLALVIAFFEERRGRLFGFRFKDPMDHKSCIPSATIQATDQLIAVGDGISNRFKLIKNYGEGEGKWQRHISKPVENTLLVAVEGILQVEASDYVFDNDTGEIVFQEGKTPAAEARIYSGFEYDVPVRFDVDEITVNMTNFIAGEIASIPLVEILL